MVPPSFVNTQRLYIFFEKRWSKWKVEQLLKLAEPHCQCQPRDVCLHPALGIDSHRLNEDLGNRFVELIDPAVVLT